jgi:hypothetical protein
MELLLALATSWPFWTEVAIVIALLVLRRPLGNLISRTERLGVGSVGEA